jgi:hypothetical protein
VIRKGKVASRQNSLFDQKLLFGRLLWWFPSGLNFESNVSEVPKSTKCFLIGEKVSFKKMKRNLPWFSNDLGLPASVFQPSAK